MKEEKDVLLLCMSTLSSNPSISHYYYQNSQGGFYRFDGVSQLEPGTKYEICKLYMDRKKAFDKIIVINTPETLKADKDNTQPSAYDYYKSRVCSFLNGAIDNTIKREIDKIKYKELKEKIESEIRSKININNHYDYSEVDAIQRQVAAGIIKKFQNDFEVDEIITDYDQIKEKFYSLKNDCLGEMLDGFRKTDIEETEKAVLEYKNEIAKLLADAIADNNVIVDLLIKWEKYIYEEYRLDIKKKISEISVQRNKDIRDKQIESYQEYISKLNKRIDFLENGIKRIINDYSKEYAYSYCNGYNEKGITLFAGETINDEAFVNAIIKCYHPEEVIEGKVDGEKSLFKSIVLHEKNNVVNNDFIENKYDVESALSELIAEIDEIRRVDILEGFQSDKSHVNVYFDMQGGGRTAAYVISVALDMLEKRDVTIKSRVAIDFRNGNFVNKIREVSDEYKINTLASGLNAFIRYGRAGDLKEYVEKNNYYKMDERELESKLIDVIGKISDSIEITDPNSFDEAISRLKSEDLLSADNYPDSYFKMIVEDIRREYSSLLKQDSNVLDSIMWFIEKGFTSQALTYIEDKIPDYIINSDLDKTSIIDLSYYIKNEDKTNYEKITDQSRINQTMDLIVKKIKHAYERRISNLLVTKIGPEKVSYEKNRIIFIYLIGIIDEFLNKYLNQEKISILRRRFGKKIKINPRINKYDISFYGVTFKEIRQHENIIIGGYNKYICANLNQFVNSDLISDNDIKGLERLKQATEIDQYYTSKFGDTTFKEKIYLSCSRSSMTSLIKNLIMQVFVDYFNNVKDEGNILFDADNNGITAFINDFKYDPDESFEVNTYRLWCFIMDYLELEIDKANIDFNNDSTWLYNYEYYANGYEIALKRLIKYNQNSSLFKNSTNGKILLFETLVGLTDLYEISNKNSGGDEESILLKCKINAEKEDVEQVLQMYYKLKNLRNQSNHAVVDKERLALNEIKAMIVEFVKKIRECEKQ